MNVRNLGFVFKVFFEMCRAIREKTVNCNTSRPRSPVQSVDVVANEPNVKNVSTLNSELGSGVFQPILSQILGIFNNSVFLERGLDMSWL